MDQHCRDTLSRFVGQASAINCLELCGYANARVLQGLTDADIDNVERFVQDACQLMQPAERQGYVGQIFADCPDQFRFPAGTRKGILVGVQSLRDRLDKASQTAPPSADADAAAEPPPPAPAPSAFDTLTVEAQQQLLAACMGLGHPALCGFPLPLPAMPSQFGGGGGGGGGASSDLFGHLQQLQQLHQQQQHQHHQHQHQQHQQAFNPCWYMQPMGHASSVSDIGYAYPFVQPHHPAYSLQPPPSAATGHVTAAAAPAYPGCRYNMASSQHHQQVAKYT